jgi:type IV secretory pathway VirB4 component
MARTPTQNFIPISEIRDGVVVLKNGELRAVLLASPVNLGLKSDEEQKGTIQQFQSFLNSLEFPIQMSVSSRRLDIRPYLGLLEGREKDIKEELLRVQIREYIEFIKDFNERYNIMSKFFYVVVPYGGAVISGGLFGSKKKGQTKQQAADSSFEEQRNQLEQRVAVVEQGLSSTGVQTTRLATTELIALYQSAFNPGELHAAVPELAK